MNGIHVLKIGLFLLLTRLAGLGAVTSIYVSTNGAASGNGATIGAPVSLARAQARVREINATMSDDINVLLLPGRYPLAAPLVFTENDSGSNGFKVVWRAQDAQHPPLLCGGTPVTGWTLHDAGKNIWKAAVPRGFDTRQLYVNGRRAIRARSPEDDDFTSKRHVFPSQFQGMNATGFTTTYDVASWKNLERVEAILRVNWWRVARVPLASVSTNRVLFQQPAGRYAHRQEARTVVYLENAYELLDAEGEWYLDPTVNTVYYKLRAGETLAGATVVAARLEGLLQLKRAAGLTFRDLRLAHSTWMFPSSNYGYTTWQGGYYFGPVGNGDWQKQMPGAVQAERVRDVLFDRCIVEHVGASGITVTDGSRRVTILGCRIEDVSGHGLEIGSGLGGGHTEQIVIRNNYIHDAANEFQDNHGLFVSSANDVLVEHNELHSFPYSAVALGWGWSGKDNWYGNLKFRRNHVCDYLQKGSDGGGIYTLSSQPGSDITANYFDKNNDPGRKHDGTGYMHGGSIYLDQGSSRFTISSNVCTRTSRWLFTWANDSRTNNIQYNWSDTKEEQSVIGGKRGNPISNNTVVVNGEWPPEAKAVMERAGLELEYKWIKTDRRP